MYLIVGLGNPGKEYQNTRHNIGFDVIDVIARQENISVTEKKHKALIGKGIIAGRKVILAKPQTYMNLSGESVRSLLDYYKADETEELIVISDDVSLEPGQIRIRKKGSAGGHNGLKNIQQLLGTQEYCRLRFGIGSDFPRGGQIDYVLGKFPSEELELMPEKLKRAVEIIKSFCLAGVQITMNQFNNK